MVIQPKKNGRARMTVDLARLSKAGKHESHHKRSAAEITKSVPAGKLKSTLDCGDGYHGVELPRRTAQDNLRHGVGAVFVTSECNRDTSLLEIATSSILMQYWLHV